MTPRSICQGKHIFFGKWKNLKFCPYLYLDLRISHFSDQKGGLVPALFCKNTASPSGRTRSPVAVPLCPRKIYPGDALICFFYFSHCTEGEGFLVIDKRVDSVQFKGTVEALE